MCHRFLWHIVFFATALSHAKNPKEPTSYRTKTAVNIDRQALTEKNK